jgi:large subunit ribosomal protein L13
VNTTVRMKASQLYKDWVVIDAAGRPLGRVATEAATLLRGKHKPTFEPHLDGGDFVIVINAGKIRLTGRKAEQVKYHRHSGYPGGLKTRSFTEEFERFPERVLERSIWGMLPKGTLGEQMLKHLKVYRGPEHPHQSQIAHTEKQRAARAEAAAAAPPAPPKQRSLGFRPIREGTVSDRKTRAQKVAEQEAARPVVPARPEPLLEDATPTPAEAEAAAAEPIAAAPAEAPPAEEAAPTRRRSRAKAEAPAAEEKAPARRGRAKAEPASEEKPKAARRARAAKAEEPAAETTEKKPARRRATKDKE